MVLRTGQSYAPTAHIHGSGRSPDVDIDALSMGHEYLVLLEICVKCSQTSADARANKGFPASLEKLLVVDASERPFQV